MTLQSLYNGNIAGWMWNSRDNTGAMKTRLGSVYRYDQLNRLRVDSVHTWSGTNWTANTQNWLSYYSYDADGNIQTLARFDNGGNQFDNLTYNYLETGKPNRLTHIDDPLGKNAPLNDLDDQSANNYAYDATGNLTQDVSENIQTGGISWTPYNKIDRIVKLTGGGAQIMKLAYLYDASGNRVIKDHYATDTSSSPSRTFYIRDAQGNVMGIFKRASGETYAERQETPIYGSARLGVSYKGALHTAVATDTLAQYNTLYTRELRLRGYEFTDHLGNVRATVSDMLLPRGSGVFDADLRTLTDYYPFGMTMLGRSYEAAGIDGHRYGYNGKENDNEVKGEGNQQDYGARIYDPRVGRWLSVDPLMIKYPSLSPYNSVANSPIFYVDPDGREIKVASEVVDGKTIITITVSGQLVNESSTSYTAEQLQAFADRLASSIASSLTGSESDVSWRGIANITAATDESSLSPSDHAFRIVDGDKIPDGSGGFRPVGTLGRAAFGENYAYISLDILGGTPAESGPLAGTGKSESGGGTLERTGAHELGHSANLRHVPVGTLDGNLMHQTQRENAGMKLTKDQILEIKRAYENGQLNRGRQKAQ
jgi:RHS repeat-associated protein